MQNAHERFGLLEFTRRVKDTINEVRVQMDRLILEPGNDARAAAHLISVIGGDAAIGAVCAAVLEGAGFPLQMPRGRRGVASPGPHAKSFLGSGALPRRKPPPRHLLALSHEMVESPT